MHALIAGASGLVGSQLLKLLLDDPRAKQVTSIGRRKLEVFNSKLQQISIDFAKLDSLETPSYDVAFCCLGTTIKVAGSQEAFRRVDHDYVISFGQMAKRAGVRKFLLVSALGADASSAVFYSRTKGETENDLEALDFESLVIARPSLLLGHRDEVRLGEKLAITLTPILSPLLMGPLAAYKPVQASQVAKGLVEKAFSTTRTIEILSNSEMIKL